DAAHVRGERRVGDHIAAAEAEHALLKQPRNPACRAVLARGPFAHAMMVHGVETARAQDTGQDGGVGRCAVADEVSAIKENAEMGCSRERETGQPVPVREPDSADPHAMLDAIPETWKPRGVGRHLRMAREATQHLVVWRRAYPRDPRI